MTQQSPGKIYSGSVTLSSPGSRTGSQVALLRGVNVGGRNRIKMADLRQCFLDHGHSAVSTYIQSGNVVFNAKPGSETALESGLERMLAERFEYKARVLVRSRQAMEHVVSNAPTSFGDHPELYRCDVMFLRDELSAVAAVVEIPQQAGVDEVHAGDGVVYFRRLASQASRSRLSRITTLPIYQQMTVRNWRTTTKLLSLLS